MGKLHIRNIKTLSILLIMFVFVLTGCSSQKSETKGVLLDHLIAKEGEFIFDHIEWGKTKQDLQSDHAITEKNSREGADGAIILNDKIQTNAPKSTATVVYRFEQDLFIGGDYVIEAEDEDDLVCIAGELKNLLKEKLEDPEGNSLDELSEKSVQAELNGVTYYGEDDNNLKIIFPQSDSDLSIHLSVRGPRSVLEELL